MVLSPQTLRVLQQMHKGQRWLWKIARSHLQRLITWRTYSTWAAAAAAMMLTMTVIWPMKMPLLRVCRSLIWLTLRNKRALRKNATVLTFVIRKRKNLTINLKTNFYLCVISLTPWRMCTLLSVVVMVMNRWVDLCTLVVFRLLISKTMSVLPLCLKPPHVLNATHLMVSKQKLNL